MIAVPPPAVGVGVAVADRLIRAARPASEGGSGTAGTGATAGTAGRACDGAVRRATNDA
ncbi:MAG: hypothetical protein QG608_1569, partial [Actinomycetota bacterium]|nr:hypothetical protein [Actinomycetota bacterium]